MVSNWLHELTREKVCDDCARSHGVHLTEMVAQSTTCVPNQSSFMYYRVGNEVIGVREPIEADAHLLRKHAIRAGLSNQQLADRGYDAVYVAATLGVDVSYANRLALLGRYLKIWDVSQFWFGRLGTDSRELSIVSEAPLK